ncbi:unnamed protein product [Victoria cruziana]
MSSPQPPSVSAKRSASRLWRLVRAAVFMIRRSSAKKLAPVDIEKGILKKLIAAMRPLHHNLHRTPASSHVKNQGEVELHGGESLYGVFWLPPPPLPLASEEGLEEEDNDEEDIGGDDGEFVVSADSEIQYSPAANLAETDSSSGSSLNGPPNAIDLRAEEFIAGFYEQIRLQRLDSLNRYKEMMGRGA